MKRSEVKVTQLCPTLWDPMDLLVHAILQARILEWVTFPFSRGIFPTPGSNPGLPHCRWILCQLSHKGSPRILEWVAYPFSRRSSWPRNWTRVSCITGGFFTHWAMREAFVSSVCASAELWASLYGRKGYILYFFLFYKYNFYMTYT